MGIIFKMKDLSNFYLKIELKTGLRVFSPTVPCCSWRRHVPSLTCPQSLRRQDATPSRAHRAKCFRLFWSESQYVNVQHDDIIILAFWLLSAALTATWGLKCSGTVCKCSKEVKVMKLDLHSHRYSSWHGGMESWNQGWMVSTKQPRQVPVMPGY